MPLRTEGPYFAVITIQLIVAVPKLDRAGKCVQAERNMQPHVYREVPCRSWQLYGLDERM
jgi:hypothetical protein